MKGLLAASSVFRSSPFLSGFAFSRVLTDHLAGPVCLFFLFVGRRVPCGRIGVATEEWPAKQGFFVTNVTSVPEAMLRSEEEETRREETVRVESDGLVVQSLEARSEKVGKAEGEPANGGHS